MQYNNIFGPALDAKSGPRNSVGGGDWHITRSFATWLKINGADVNERSFMRQSRETTTLDVLQHLFLESQSEGGGDGFGDLSPNVQFHFMSIKRRNREQ